MNASNRDRVEVLLRRLPPSDGGGVQAATQRWCQGRASWEDRELMATPDLIDARRLPFLKDLPGEVAQRARNPKRVGNFDKLPLDPYFTGAALIREVVSYPPDEELPLSLQRAVEVVQTRWSQVTDLALDLAWTSLRLVLGADGGDSFRRDCWKDADGIWVLRHRVIAQAAQAWRRYGYLGPIVKTNQQNKWFLGHPTSQRLVDLLAEHDQDNHPWLAAHAFQATYLELAIMTDPQPDPPWVPAKARSRILGQHRSNPVTPPDELPTLQHHLRQVLEERAARCLRAQIDAPKPWRPAMRAKEAQRLADQQPP